MSVASESKVLRHKCNSKENTLLANGSQADLETQRNSHSERFQDTGRCKNKGENPNTNWIKGFVTYQNGSGLFIEQSSF